MRWRVLISLLALGGCLRENGAFDGDAAGSAGMTATGVGTTVGPGSGPTSSTTEGSTTSVDPSASGTGASSSGTTEAISGTAAATTGDATTGDVTTGDATTGDATGDATTGEPVVVPTLCDRPPGAWKVSGVKKLGMPVNQPQPDLDMWLSEPGMLLLWSSHRDGKVDTYRASRKNFGANFDQAFANNADIGLSTPGDDTKLTLSKGEDRAYLAAKMPDDVGYRLYMGDRQQGSYAPLTAVALELPGYPEVLDPHISTDDLRLYYAATSADDQRLAVAVRPGPDQPFGPPSVAPFVNIDEPGRREADPTLPAHELVLIYVRSGDLAETGNDIYVATRASTSEPFGEPGPLVGANSALHDMSPHVSRDGCELFFVRGTDKDPFDWDIYRAEIQ